MLDQLDVTPPGITRVALLVQLARAPVAGDEALLFGEDAIVDRGRGSVAAVMSVCSLS